MSLQKRSVANLWPFVIYGPIWPFMAILLCFMAVHGKI